MELEVKSILMVNGSDYEVEDKVAIWLNDGQIFKGEIQQVNNDCIWIDLKSTNTEVPVYFEDIDNIDYLI